MFYERPINGVLGLGLAYIESSSLLSCTGILNSNGLLLLFTQSLFARICLCIYFTRVFRGSWSVNQIPILLNLSFLLNQTSRACFVQIRQFYQIINLINSNPRVEIPTGNPQLQGKNQNSELQEKVNPNS